MVVGDGNCPLVEASNLAMSHSLYLLAQGYTPHEVDSAIKRAWGEAASYSKPMPDDIRPRAFLALLTDRLQYTERYLEGKRNQRPHLYTQLTPEALVARVGGTIEEYIAEDEDYYDIP